MAATGPRLAVGRVVADIELDLAWRARDPDGGGDPSGVVEDVGERLLDDAVGGDGDPRRAAPRESPVVVSSSGQAGSPEPVGQPVELVAGRAGGPTPPALVLAAQHPEGPAQIGERLAGCVLDGGQASRASEALSPAASRAAPAWMAMTLS